MKARVFGCCGAFILLWSAPVEATCAGPWQRLPDAGAEVLRPVPLVLVGGAAVIPLVMAPTNADYEARSFSQTTLGGSYRPERVSLLTPYVVVGATGLTYVAGLLFDSCPVERQTSAMIQGIVGTAAIVALTKWSTGRSWPNGGRDPRAEDRLEHPEDGRDFDPFSRGLSAAFPSGHTAIVFAAAAALRASSPRGVFWRFVLYPIAAGVGFGMVFGDHHFTSDVLSGALLGEALGGAAGRAWRDDTVEVPATETSVEWQLLPTLGGATFGAQGTF